MEAIKIKGKDYITVNERIKEFRNNEAYKDWAIVTEFVSLTTKDCVIKASIIDENGIVKATGHAQEDRDVSLINQTSYVENCETSAIGRALGCLGIGIDTSVASADEMQLALAKQEKIMSKQELLGGEYVFKGGKHAGKAIKDTPKDYLEWYVQNGGDEFIKRNIRKFAEEQNAEIRKSMQPVEVDI